jgi:hypothetical protein
VPAPVTAASPTCGPVTGYSMRSAMHRYAAELLHARAWSGRHRVGELMMTAHRAAVLIAVQRGARPSGPRWRNEPSFPRR